MIYAIYAMDVLNEDEYKDSNKILHSGTNAASGQKVRQHRCIVEKLITPALQLARAGWLTALCIDITIPMTRNTHPTNLCSTASHGILHQYSLTALLARLRPLLCTSHIPLIRLSHNELIATGTREASRSTMGVGVRGLTPGSGNLISKATQPFYQADMLKTRGCMLKADGRKNDISNEVTDIGYPPTTTTLITRPLPLLAKTPSQSYPPFLTLIKCS